jgi:hypothetical protein
MRAITLPILFGTLLAAGTLPALAQPAQVATPVAVGASTKTPYRQTFEADARARLRVWSSEITDFNSKAEATGTATDNEAGAALTTAWAETKAEEAKLEIAGADSWETARATYDDAAEHFQTALDRARSAL